MKEVKDLFSKQAATYAAFRPVYPNELYEFLFGITENFDTVWDCGTGNGQVANRLSERFATVFATDISEKQLDNAVKKDNIIYKVCRAEASGLADSSVDLITVGTALHWFDLDSFYKEVKRVAKTGASIAVWCYAPFRAEPSLNELVDYFYKDIVGKYWDPERKWVDEEYKTIPFPFEEIPAPKLEIKVNWTKEQWTGYLRSWSAVQHYINDKGTDPVLLIQDRLDGLWQDGEVKELVFPLFIRAGKVHK